LPPVVIDMIAGFDRDTAQGYYAMATPVVAELTGRKPTAIRAFLEANRDALLGKAA
jgi:NAD(P)H dehydrogenase (quinone)